MGETRDITALLDAAREGDAGATNRLFEAVYIELHRMARVEMANEARRVTLQPTALVHEAWIKMIGPHPDPLLPGEGVFASRKYFFAAAARAMRQILVEYARRRKADKRGGPSPRPSPIERGGGEPAVCDGDATDLLALDEAMKRLAEEDLALVDVVELRYFAGLTEDQIAAVMEVSPRTVSAYWCRARVRLRTLME